MLAGVMLVLLAFSLRNSFSVRPDITYKEFQKRLEAGQVAAVDIQPNQEVPTGVLRVTARDGSETSVNVLDVTEVQKLLEEFLNYDVLASLKRLEEDAEIGSATYDSGNGAYIICSEEQIDRNATLSAGQMILVPKSSAHSSTGEDETYTVQKGDTLGKIAKKFGTTVAKLREQNHLKKDTIYVGQKLYLSGAAPVREKSASSKSDAAPIEGDTYTVQAGDSLWIIAKRCRRSVAELTRLNDLKNPEQLQVGQVLRLKERSRATGKKSSYSKKSFEAPAQTRSFTEPKHEGMPVERHREEELASKSDVSDAPKPSSTFEEDDFKDLFEENKDMPVVPLDVQ